ncbi:MAG: hypothetical protein IT428_03795 [Planctomycetaceae bacterium]|nr:hypothetical protein [Planctomycetaceae bacterium]
MSILNSGPATCNGAPESASESSGNSPRASHSVPIASIHDVDSHYLARIALPRGLADEITAVARRLESLLNVARGIIACRTDLRMGGRTVRPRRHWFDRSGDPEHGFDLAVTSTVHVTARLRRTLANLQATMPADDKASE